jgi:hypothetical protein
MSLQDIFQNVQSWLAGRWTYPILCDGCDYRRGGIHNGFRRREGQFHRGPKGEKGPADVIGAAIMVGRMATGDETVVLYADRRAIEIPVV